MPGHPKEVFKHPVLVPGLAGKVVVRVVSGGDHAMALTDDGELYTWGCDEQGRLGRDQRQTRHVYLGLRIAWGVRPESSDTT